MPNIKSAAKALRQTRRRKIRNVGKKNALKDAIKQFKKFIQAGKTDQARELLNNVYQKLDKAAKTGVIKKNKASRLKSRTTKLLKTK